MNTGALTFLFPCQQSEELAAEHVIREHRRGRAMVDILADPYLTNHCSEEQIRRLFDRPEVIHAVGDDVVAAHRSAV